MVSDGGRLDLQQAKADLAEASNVIDGADAPYNWAALQAMRTAESLVAEVERLTQERDEAQRIIRNAHQAIRTNTTAAAVALAMFDAGDVGTPSLLDELNEARDKVTRLTQENTRLQQRLEAAWERGDERAVQSIIFHAAERDVIEKAEAWRAAWEATMNNPAGPGMRREVLALLAAVDALGDSQGDTDG